MKADDRLTWQTRVAVSVSQKTGVMPAQNGLCRDSRPKGSPLSSAGNLLASGEHRSPVAGEALTEGWQGQHSVFGSGAGDNGPGSRKGRNYDAFPTKCQMGSKSPERLNDSPQIAQRVVG